MWVCPILRRVTAEVFCSSLDIFSGKGQLLEAWFFWSRVIWLSVLTVYFPTGREFVYNSPNVLAREGLQRDYEDIVGGVGQFSGLALDVLQYVQLYNIIHRCIVYIIICCRRISVCTWSPRTIRMWLVVAGDEGAAAVREQCNSCAGGTADIILNFKCDFRSNWNCVRARRWQ